MTALLHPLCLGIDSTLTRLYPASSKLETEPQYHHRLPIRQRIADAGPQGLRREKPCCMPTKDVVG
jgi:hypothetical protein